MSYHQTYASFPHWISCSTRLMMQRSYILSIDAAICYEQHSLPISAPINSKWSTDERHAIHHVHSNHMDLQLDCIMKGKVQWLCAGEMKYEKWMQQTQQQWSNEIEMRREHTLTIRMIGRMTIFGSWTYWICYAQKGYKSPIISMGNMDKGKVYRKRWKWFGNGNVLNGPDIMEPDVVRSILNGNMGMFGRTHGKI